MKLNVEYCVNIVSQFKSQDSFIVALKLNQGSSKDYLNYRKSLLDFKSCETNEWFEKLDYPMVETGTAVIVKTNETTNEWARGIVSKYDYNLLHEIYLIDTQTFMKKKNQFELKVCPRKYLKLKVPTYIIRVDVDLSNGDILKYVIAMMIKKNHYGELNITFTPQSIQNDYYFGLLMVNNIPLKKYFKVLSKQYSKIKAENLSTFNPLQFHHLKNIFIPRHLSNSLERLDDNLDSSCADLNDLNKSFENLSCDPVVEYNSIIDDSKDFSDDSSLTTGSSKHSCIVPIVKQKIYSSFSSLSMSDSSSSYNDVEHDSPKSLSVNRQTNCMSQNVEEQHESINIETTAVNKNENNSNIVDIGSTEIKNQDNNTNLLFMKSLMKKRASILRQKNIECQQSTNITKISNVLENSDIFNDSNIIWWSSDDES